MKKLMAMLLLAGSIQGVYAQKTEKKEMFLENKFNLSKIVYIMI